MKQESRRQRTRVKKGKKRPQEHKWEKKCRVGRRKKRKW